MSAPKNGGPAFPCPVGHIECAHPTGMTLRDYFAAKAMQGAISTFASYGDWFPSEVAELAYKQADAMLDARVQGGQP